MEENEFLIRLWLIDAGGRRCIEETRRMPTSGELIAIVAKSTGLPSRSVATLFRTIREAGLVGTGGRGRSAMHLDLGDATKLLAACLASDEARFAHLAVAATYDLIPGPVRPRSHRIVRDGSIHFLKPDFLARLPTVERVRPASFCVVAEDVMLAIGREALWSSPALEDYEGTFPSVAKAGDRSRRFATMSVTCYVQAEAFSVTSAEIAFGLRGLYDVIHTFKTSDREKRALEAGHGHTMRQKRSVHISALKMITSSFSD